MTRSGGGGYMPTKAFEDFEVGDKFTSPSRTITETDIVNFAGISGDYYPLHIDEVYARETIFGGRVAHGALIYAISVGLVASTGVFADSLVAFLGVEHLRHLAPVRPGDTMRVDVEIIDKQETRNPKRGVVTMKYKTKNQDDEEVMVASLNFMMHRRDEG